MCLLLFLVVAWTDPANNTHPLEILVGTVCMGILVVLFWIGWSLANLGYRKPEPLWTCSRCSKFPLLSNLLRAFY